MASTNPLFILPGAMAERGEKLAAGLHASFTLGAGQFCTKPGLVFVNEDASSTNFLATLRQKVTDNPSFTLLTAGIATSFGREASKREKSLTMPRAITGAPASSGGAAAALATLYETDISGFAADPSLAEEHFGPSTIVIRYSEKEQILKCASELKGHLTATIHGTPEDLAEYSELIRILETKVGRIVFNGFPTGVEVSHAMIHGGPYPASTDSRTTSVGSLAIFRFARPVCYQDFPNEALPAELKNENPLGIWRLIDGECIKESS